MNWYTTWKLNRYNARYLKGLMTPEQARMAVAPGSIDNLSRVQVRWWGISINEGRRWCLSVQWHPWKERMWYWRIG